ncbi:hypothetical protein [Pseudomonas sp. Z13]|uniref:hypothetical protein n=1 Tax=Pseudomonas sp. Z13 TaxID=2983409 RepID=UPI002E81781A|nr:hypothetical protein [Pseudomonas sp. Z13]
MSDNSDLKAAATYAAQDVTKFADEDEESRALQKFHLEVSPEAVLTLFADLEESRNGIKHSCAIRLKKEIERLEGERDQLKAFAVEMINASFEGGSFEGGDIQDIAVKHGLLQIEQREDECGEACACREYGFPAECYRKTPIIGAVTDEVATQSTDTENVSRHDRR